MARSGVGGLRCWGPPRGPLPQLLEGIQQLTPRWMLPAHLGTSTAPFRSRTWGILGKHHDLLPKKCLLTELPPLGTLTCGIGGTLFSDIRALYSTWGADAWHQPSCATVNGGLLQSVGVTSALDSSSIPFPWCDVIFLLLTWTSTKRHPSLLPVLEFVTCSFATELIVLSLQSLP